MTADILRYAAFTADPDGGNPAGVVLDATHLDDEQMQRIAAEVDFSETAFVTGERDGARIVRYFSPISEVPFCGHATIAAAVALAEREGSGEKRFATRVGEIRITTVTDADGAITASFTSVEPAVADFPPGVLDQLFTALGLTAAQLDDRLPPKVAFAGNWHPVLAIADAEDFDGFTFDPAVIRRMMDDNGWSGTVTVVRALDSGSDSDDSGPDRGCFSLFETRNLFPVGRITEDPATGSAGASLGGYLRELALVEPPARVLIRQGRHVDRPSELTVDVPASGGVTVSGRAVPMAG
ncbi:PhzF family phenazine biosynthesis protein [Glaciibacter flavus]|uniref:PhzF family phenazine biosynthesis protein n=1 Tax=Orlajensenia flava TaxID=2565934 RepID=UPI003AFFBAF4